MKAQQSPSSSLSAATPEVSRFPPLPVTWQGRVWHNVMGNVKPFINCINISGSKFQKFDCCDRPL
jgi:hypothetical protein